jgi:hypothetical protein
MQLVQWIFLILIALVIPAFFALLFVMSAYHRLASMRRRCEEILQDAEHVRDVMQLAQLRNAYDQAIRAYDDVCGRFPMRWLARLFRIAAPRPWQMS